MTNPYVWRHDPEWSTDGAASYSISRGDESVSRIHLTRDLPFHPLILAELCRILWQVERGDLTASELEQRIDDAQLTWEMP